MKFGFVILIILFTVLSCGKNNSNAQNKTSSSVAPINVIQSKKHKDVEKFKLSEISIEQREHIYIYAIIKLSSFFHPYQAYILQNGLYNDTDIAYIRDKLNNNKSFLEQLKIQTSYYSAEDFFNEFSIFSKAYFYANIKKQISSDSQEAYLVKLSDMEKQLLNAISSSTNIKHKKELEQNLAEIRMYKKLLVDSKSIEKEIAPEIITIVEKNEDDFLYAYVKLMNLLKGD